MKISMGGVHLRATMRRMGWIDRREHDLDCRRLDPVGTVFSLIDLRNPLPSQGPDCRVVLSSEYRLKVIIKMLTISNVPFHYPLILRVLLRVFSRLREPEKNSESLEYNTQWIIKGSVI